MLPIFASTNAADSLAIDIERCTNLPVQHASVSHIADFLDIFFGDFSVVLFFTSIASKYVRGMFHVLMRSAVFEVAQLIVGFCSVFMVDLCAFRSRANEGKHYKSVYTKNRASVIAMQFKASVSLVVYLVTKYKPSLCTFDLSMIADLVQTFVARYRLPDFIGHLRFSFAGFANRGCGQAAKQAVHPVHETGLVHYHIIPQNAVGEA